MINKKVKALIFLFLILFCISTVSAESINDTDVNTSPVEIMEVESNTYVAAIEEAIDIGNFSDLNRTINSNIDEEIKLNKSYTYNNDTDYAFKNGITINKNITIDGQILLMGIILQEYLI